MRASMPFSAPPSRPTSLRGVLRGDPVGEVAGSDPVGLRGCYRMRLSAPPRARRSHHNGQG